MDHMLRNGMWAPVETRIFHHIILVSPVVFVLERVVCFHTIHVVIMSCFNLNFDFFAENDRISNRASRC